MLGIVGSIHSAMKEQNMMPNADARRELLRTLLPKLSEKGYEQRSEREFKGVGRQKWTEK
jgi:hypothetical protein